MKALAPVTHTKEVTKALAADLKLPLVEAALRQAGFDEKTLQEWLLNLSRIHLSDEQIVVLIDEAQLALKEPSSKIKKQFSIWRHKASHLLNHKRLSERLAYTSGWLILLAGATFKAGLGVWGYVSGAVVVLIKARSIWREIDPSHLPMLQRTLVARQLLLHRLLHESQVWTQSPPTTREVETFRVDVLRLIASYVRDHRSDLNGRSIFVNLLVRRNDRVVVIARSDDKRPVPKTYSAEECSIVWSAINTGAPQATGDVHSDAPKTGRGKSYQSILALPVRLKSGTWSSIDR